MSNNSHSIFADKGFSFEDILYRGNLGGRTAVVSYLDVRIRQLNRMVETTNSAGLDRARLILSIRAMTEARKVAFNLRPD
jgi:hypothetical protein